MKQLNAQLIAHLDATQDRLAQVSKPGQRLRYIYHDSWIRARQLGYDGNQYSWERLLAKFSVPPGIVNNREESVNKTAPVNLTRTIRTRTLTPPMSPAAHYSGFLIAIEGIDGAGKTTQAHFIQDELMSRGFQVMRTKEPTTGQWGQVLRDSALTGRLSIEEEVEAFIKDRREHVTEKIMLALLNGMVVIVDRYYFSTAAYQGARGVDPQELLRRNEEFAPEPDLLILLDVDPKVGLKRIRTRGDRANLFEQNNTLRRAREIFLQHQKAVSFQGRRQLNLARGPPHVARAGVRHAMDSAHRVQQGRSA